MIAEVYAIPADGQFCHELTQCCTKISVGLGPIEFEAGIQQTIDLTSEKPFYLFIVYRDSTGIIYREEYEIGKKFKVVFSPQESVRQIQGNNDSVVVAVDRLEFTTRHPNYDRELPPIPAPIGWPFEQDRVQLNLVKAEIRDENDYESAALYLIFTLLNKTSQELLVEFDYDQIFAVDSRGNYYIDWDGSNIETFYLQSGEVRVIEKYYTPVPGEEYRIPPSALPVTVYVNSLSRIQGAQWLISSPPIYEYHTYYDGDIAGNVGVPFYIENFSVTLTNLEIRTSDDYEDAAFYAEFTVENTSSEPRLLDLDYSYIYLEDNFGTRYIDYYGAGFESRWIDPGEIYTFDRYYTTQYDEASRIPIGTAYIVVICEGIGGGSRAQWRFDIVR